MRKSKQFFFLDEYEIEISCSISPGYPGRGPSMENAGGEPPEPPEVEDLCVRLVIEGERVDITDLLSEKQYAHIEEYCFENAEGES